MPSQGEIYDYDFGPRQDHRQEGRRPALVIQTDLINEIPDYGLTIIVPMTTKGRNSPTHVRIEPNSDNGLSAISFAKAEQIYTVPTHELVERRGKIDASELHRIKEALRIVLNL